MRNPIEARIDELKAAVLRLQPADFDDLALEIFRFQSRHCAVYAEYLSHLGNRPKNVRRPADIPFLPIGFFKSREVRTGSRPARMTFRSSGTTGEQTARHFVADTDFYARNARQIFEQFYGPISDFRILALLPSYLERGDSSLVFMVKKFMESAAAGSGFFMDNLSELNQKLAETKTKTLLIGVTYALLDLAEQFPQILENTIVMETGGMKGRRKELDRPELHRILRRAFGAEQIHSEYGMTELLSQAYSRSEGLFELPACMRIYLRSPQDPFAMDNGLRAGGICVADLANIESCAFVETQDLGRFAPDGRPEIVGRYDNSDIRGCNLLYDSSQK